MLRRLASGESGSNNGGALTHRGLKGTIDLPEPLNILMTNSGRRWIGEVGHTVQLIGGLRARGHNVWLACRQGTRLEEFAREAGLPHVTPIFNSRFGTTDLGDIGLLRRVIREQRIDLVHAHRGKDHWLAMAAARAEGKPLVRTRHVVTPVKQQPFNTWIYTKATAALISVSNAAAGSLGPLAHKARRHEVILSAVDLEKFRPELRSGKWRRKHATPGYRAGDVEPVWVGIIGRLQGVKGQEHFIEAARVVAERRPEAHFLIAGRGAKSKGGRYERFAANHGFADRLVVTGMLENLPEALASLDVSVIASIGSEGSSRVTLESMASGTALVATTVGGIPEILAPGESAGKSAGKSAKESAGEAHKRGQLSDTLADENRFGLLVPPGDAEALADAVLELLNDSAGRRRLAERARCRAEERHSVERWVEQIESVYRAVLAEQRETRREAGR